MPPIGAAIALPPGAADRVRAHSEPHAKLKNSSKSARRRQANHQALQDPDLRICFHQTNETQDCVGSHKTVRVQGDCKLVIMTPAVAEISDVAGLISDVD